MSSTLAEPLAASALSVRKGTSQTHDVELAAQELFEALNQPDIKLAVFYCSPAYDLPALAGALHERFQDIPLIGCTTAGEITPMGYLSGALTGFSLAAPSMEVATRLISSCAALASVGSLASASSSSGEPSLWLTLTCTATSCN